MLSLTVVVAEDRARADVHALADQAVADVGEVVHLRALAHDRLLGLAEVPDLGVFGEVAAGPEMREGSDVRAGSDVALGRHAVGEHDGVRVHDHVREHGARADARARRHPSLSAQVHTGLDHTVRLEHAVRLDEGQLGRQQARTRQRVGAVDALTHVTLGQRQVDAIVHAQELAHVRGRVRHAAGRRGQRDDVREQDLALRVLRAELLQGFAQERRVDQVEARVHLVDERFSGGAVLGLTDGRDLARVVAQDASVGGGIVDSRRQQRELLAPGGGLGQSAQGLGPDHRAVAVQDEHALGALGHLAHGALHRVARASWIGLQRRRHAFGEARVDVGAHRVGAVADHDHDRVDARLERRVRGPGVERSTRDLVQHLRPRALHALAVARREHQRHRPSQILRHEMASICRFPTR